LTEIQVKIKNGRTFLDKKVKAKIMAEKGGEKADRPC